MYVCSSVSGLLGSTLPAATILAGIVLQCQLLHLDCLPVRRPEHALGPYLARNRPPFYAHLRSTIRLALAITFSMAFAK